MLAIMLHNIQLIKAMKPDISQESYALAVQLTIVLSNISDLKLLAGYKCIES